MGFDCNKILTIAFLFTLQIMQYMFSQLYDWMYFSKKGTIKKTRVLISIFKMHYTNKINDII